MKVRDFLLELCGLCIMRVCRIDIEKHARFELFLDECLNETVVRFFSEDNVLYLVID